MHVTAPSSGKLPGGASLSFLALLGGQLVLIYLFQQQLAEVLVTKPEYLYLRVLPGLTWPLCFAWLFAAWRARSRRATALPLGYSLLGALWLVTAVLQPIFRQGLAQGIGVERAGSLAWSAGVALTLIVGVGQLVLAPLAPYLLRWWSRSLCLCLGGAISLVQVALILPWMMANPLLSVSGLIALAFLPVGLPKPFGLSAAWLAVGAGCMAQVVSSTSFPVPELSGSLLPNWEWGFIRSGFDFLWVQPEFLSGAVPMILGSLMRDLVLLRESQSQDSPPRVGVTLLGVGFLNVLGAFIGCGLPLGVLPGFLGFRRLEGGQLYSQAAGLALLALCLLGGFSQLVSLLPLPTLGVLLSGQLLLSASTGLNGMGPNAGTLLAASWLPLFASVGTGSNALSPAAYLTSLVWGGIAVSVRSQQFDAAAWVSLSGSVLASTGLLHGRGFTMEFDEFAGAYLTLAILFRVGHLLRERPAPATPEPPPALDEEILLDNNENLGRLAFDNPGDSRSAEGAGSGTLP